MIMPDGTPSLVHSLQAKVVADLCAGYRFRRVEAWRNIAGIPCDPYTSFIIERKETA